MFRLKCLEPASASRFVVACRFAADDRLLRGDPVDGRGGHVLGAARRLAVAAVAPRPRGPHRGAVAASSGHRHPALVPGYAWICVRARA